MIRATDTLATHDALQIHDQIQLDRQSACSRSLSCLLPPPHTSNLQRAACMAASELSRKLRLILESSPDAPSLTNLLDDVASFVPTSTADTLAQLEDELMQICNDIIDHSK